MYIILAVIIIGFGTLNKGFLIEEDARTYGDDWREVLQEENESILKEQAEIEQKLADYDKKNPDQASSGDYDTERYEIEWDAPDLEKIVQNSMYLEKDLKPTGYGAWQFVADNANVLAVVAMLSIIVAAGIVAQEFRWGTIKLLLIRPISRTKIILSKYIGVLIFTFVTLLFVLILSWLIGALLFGIEGANPQMLLFDMTNIDNVDMTGKLVSTYSQVIGGFGYGLVDLVMMTTFAFMISAIFRNSSLAIGVALFLYLVGGSITGVLAVLDIPLTKYILFINSDLKQYADGNVWIEGMTLGFSVTVLAVYYLIFIALSWIFFVKRDVA